MDVERSIHRGAIVLALPIALALAGCTTSDTEPDAHEVAPDESPTAPDEDTSPSPEETSPSPQERTEPEESETNEPPDGQGVDDEELTDFTDAAQESENWEEDFILDVGHDTMQVLADVRHGVHQGYERVVLEYSEDTDLASRAEYEEPADEPDSPPASLLIEILGTTGGPEAEDLAITEPWRSDADENAVGLVEPLALAGGESEVRIGLDQERPFRLHHAEDPMRIIIDIATH